MVFPSSRLAVAMAMMAASLLVAVCSGETEDEAIGHATATMAAVPSEAETQEPQPSVTALLPSPTSAQPTAAAGAEELARDHRHVGRDVPMFRGDPANTGVNPGPGVGRSSKLLWRFKTGGFVSSSPAVVGWVVYVGSRDRHVYALDAATGEELWHSATGHGVHSSPVVADGSVYIGSVDRHVYALDAATGEELWRFKMDTVWFSPAVVDGVVYIGSDDTHVYAITEG